MPTIRSEILSILKSFDEGKKTDRIATLIADELEKLKSQKTKVSEDPEQSMYDSGYNHAVWNGNKKIDSLIKQLRGEE